MTTEQHSRLIDNLDEQSGKAALLDTYTPNYSLLLTCSPESRYINGFGL